MPGLQDLRGQQGPPVPLAQPERQAPQEPPARLGQRGLLVLQARRGLLERRALQAPLAQPEPQVQRGRRALWQACLSCATAAFR